LDILIVGAGPAGLAGCLQAKLMKKRYLCIEQNSFGGTVCNFPRQKLVMSRQAELPLEGVMKFKNNVVYKEELMEYWNQLRHKHNLNIKEKTKFDSVGSDGNVFVVKTSVGEIRTQKLLLALGVGGSPRKLGLPNEDLSKVTYKLLDPDDFTNKNIAIVGGGNSAVEAAQYLAKEHLNNKIWLIVRGDKDSGLQKCATENQEKI